MAQTLSRYYLTDTRGGKNRRYVSSWKMSAAEAAARGLTDKDIVPGSMEERRELGRQSAGYDGARTPRTD